MKNIKNEMNFNTKEINEIRDEIKYLKLLLECYDITYKRCDPIGEIEKSYWIIKDELKLQQEKFSLEIQKISVGYRNGR